MARTSRQRQLVGAIELLLVMGAVARAEPNPPVRKTEVGAVPLVGGDSDIGFGGGVLGSITHLAPGYPPYQWRLELGAIATFKHDEHEWKSPYQDFYLLWTDPHLIERALRFEVRPSYTHEGALLYYGIGNATAAPSQGPNGESASRYYRYGRFHPTMLARMRASWGRGFYSLSGASLTLNRIDVHPGSLLDMEARAAQAQGGGPFGELDEHAVMLFEYAVLYDTRDDETATHAGHFHQLKIRMSPGGAGAFPYRYGQVNATMRAYVTPVPRWLTIAVRLVGDGQFGNPPFYELARFEDTPAVGGGKGVRGVPAQRYYGKVKVLANLEFRSEVLPLRIKDNDYNLGLAAFIDAGRVWADWHRDPVRDGTELGLKWGIGGGLRFQQGKAFVVRGDIVWSPDATPIGAYFTAGQIF